MMKRTILLFFLIVCFAWKSQAKVYQDKEGYVTLEKVDNLTLPSTLYYIRTSPNGFVSRVPRSLTDSWSKADIFEWSEKQGWHFLAGDDSPEIASKNQFTAVDITVLKDGVYVGITPDILRYGYVVSAAKIGYDGKVKVFQNFGLNQPMTVTFRAPGKRTAISKSISLPYPTKEEGKYYYLSTFKDEALINDFGSGLFLFDEKTGTSTEVFTLPNGERPDQSQSLRGFWTNGSETIFSSILSSPEAIRIARYTTSFPVQSTTLFQYGRMGNAVNGEPVQGPVGFPYLLDLNGNIQSGYLTGVPNNIRRRYYRFDEKGQGTLFLASEDVSAFGPLLPTLSQIMYQEPCFTVFTGTTVKIMTGVLVCKDEQPVPFLRDGMFPDGIQSEVMYANIPDGSGAYVVRKSDMSLWIARKTPPNVPPHVNLFITKPAQVLRNQETTLVWDVTGSTSTHITNVGPVAASGSITLVPQRDTEFTLSAENDAGATKSSVYVEVIDGPWITALTNARFEIPPSYTSGEAVSVFGQDLCSAEDKDRHISWSNGTTSVIEYCSSSQVNFRLPLYTSPFGGAYTFTISGGESPPTQDYPVIFSPPRRSVRR